MKKNSEMKSGTDRQTDRQTDVQTEESAGLERLCFSPLHLWNSTLEENFPPVPFTKPARPPHEFNQPNHLISFCLIKIKIMCKSDAAKLPKQRNEAILLFASLLFSSFTSVSFNLQLIRFFVVIKKKDL